MDNRIYCCKCGWPLAGREIGYLLKKGFNFKMDTAVCRACKEKAPLRASIGDLTFFKNVDPKILARVWKK